MLTEDRTLVVLGGSGFVGSHMIRAAVRAGRRVKALARSSSAAASVRELGAAAFTGDAASPETWIHEVRGAWAIVDLIQPALPKRVGRRAIERISRERQTFTRALTLALATLPAEERPILLSISGIDDLAPSADGSISEQSALRCKAYGFNRIGIPVRRIVEQSGIDAAYLYLATVYGPGKAFADTIFPSIASGKWKNFGSAGDLMALVHAEDAASGIVHVAGLPKASIRGRTLVFGDGCPVAVNAFFDFAAAEMHAPAPGRVPRWLAALFAGATLVEATASNIRVPFVHSNYPERGLTYLTYREGLTATLRQLGYGQSESVAGVPSSPSASVAVDATTLTMP